MLKLRSNLAWLGTPLRIALAVLLTIIGALAAASWSTPLLSSMERAAYSARTALNAPGVEQDDRIALVVYSDQTVFDTGERSPLDRTILAEALANIDAARPRTIGIDMIIDSPQPDDALLIGALRALNTPTYFGYSSVEADGAIQFEQAQFIDHWFKQLGTAVSPAGVQIALDRDGTVRNWPMPQDPPALAAAMATHGDGAPQFQSYSGPIDFRAGPDPDTPRFAVFDIASLADPEMAPFLAEMIEGRHVLIGSDLINLDRFDVPPGITSFDSLSGVEVHAHMLAQALDNRRIEPLSMWINVAPVIISLLVGAALASAVRSRVLAFAVVLLVTSSLLALSILAERTLASTINLGVVGWVLALVTGFVVAIAIERSARWEQGRTATLALHRYLPPDIAESIVTRPDRLGLEGETRDVFVMFTDLEGFTGLCQSVAASQVAEFLNEYLEAICQVVLDHGGTIDKFVGDAVVAFWGAPVAHEDDAERIVHAAIEILTVTDSYKGRDIGGDTPVGRTRIGVHYGSAIVGNFGGEGRLQYTALGDTMNVAARLEGANKELHTSILISSDVHAQVRESIPCRSMGRIHVRGRSKPIEIFEPALDIPPDQLGRLNAFSSAALNGDADALVALEKWAEEHPDDRGLAGLVERIQSDRG